MNKPFPDLEALVFIVNCGQARKIIRTGRKLGFTGATVFLGTGTMTHNKKWVKLLDLADSRKEIMLAFSDAKTIDAAMPILNEKFKFDIPNHGIAFRMPINEIIGSKHYAKHKNTNEVNESMVNAIFVIVDKGEAEDVVEAAAKAGSQGATIINARGTGIHETTKVFNMEIEPEKEVVLLLAESNTTEKIITAIREAVQIDEAGKGVIFVQHVKETYGLFKSSTEKKGEV